MSAKGLATLGVVRDNRAPLKKDLGKAPTESGEENDSPSNIDILTSALPTGLVAAYTTFVASISALVEDPTPEKPDPENYEAILWIGLVVLVGLAIGFVVKHYQQNGGTKSPKAEIAVAAIASLGWGLAIPESPLAISLGDDYNAGIPPLIALAFGGVVLLLTDQKLQKKRDDT